jgi:hypothetical protein
MKKIILCAVFSLTLFNVNAEDLIDVSWNFGSGGFGINYAAADNDNFEFNAALFNVVFEQKDINIGVEFNPVKYQRFYKLQDDVETIGGSGKISFINAGAYWDLIKNSAFLLGPFASTNYLYIDLSSGINMGEYIFSGGLRFSYKVKEFKAYFDNYTMALSCEIGYRNITGQNQFYFSISGDIIAALLGIAIGMKTTAIGMEAAPKRKDTAL